MATNDFVPGRPNPNPDDKPPTLCLWDAEKQQWKPAPDTQQHGCVVLDKSELTHVTEIHITGYDLQVAVDLDTQGSLLAELLAAGKVKRR